MDGRVGRMMLTKALTGSEAMTNNTSSKKKGDFVIREHSGHILKACDSSFAKKAT